MTEPLHSAHDDADDDTTPSPIIDRVLSRRAQALADRDGFLEPAGDIDYDGDQFDREERQALRDFLATAEGADLLLVGSRGRGGFRGMLLGSVTQRVLALATCPVAVLHRQ